MPVTPPNAGPWDTANSILMATRPRVHDKVPSLQPFTGMILRETEASTQQCFNNAYRKCQSVMAKGGSSTFEKSVLIQGIPAVSSAAQDPATECWISWFGCSDGANPFPTPALPSDLMTPMWASQRPAGSQWPFSDYRRPSMPMLADGLSKGRKVNYNPGCQWRGEALYYPGATQALDFLIYYQAYFSDIVDVGTTPWFMQPVPIMRVQEALSHWICREFCLSQSQDESLDPDVRQQFMAAMPYFEEQAMTATALLVSPDKKRRQRMNYTRMPFAGGGGRGGSGNSGGLPAWTGP